MSDFICKKCGSTEYEIKDRSNGTGIAHGLYCAKCGFWHKWLGKEELKQYATKKSEDEIIAKLQSENAALRERLEKAVELPVKECLRILHRLGGCDATDGFSRGWDEAINTAFKKISEKYDISAEEVFDDECPFAELKGGENEQKHDTTR